MFRSVFYDIEDDPAIAADLEARSRLMMSLERLISENGWSADQAGQELRIPVAQVSQLLNGEIHRFSLQELSRLSSSVGL